MHEQRPECVVWCRQQKFFSCPQANERKTQCGQINFCHCQWEGLNPQNIREHRVTETDSTLLHALLRIFLSSGTSKATQEYNARPLRAPFCFRPHLYTAAVLVYSSMLCPLTLEAAELPKRVRPDLPLVALRFSLPVSSFSISTTRRVSVKSRFNFVAQFWG